MRSAWIRSCPLLVALIAFAEARAEIILVPSEEPTIHSALHIAQAGDSVVVDCGTYYESKLPMRAGVTLLSVARDPDCVVIDGM